MATAWDILCEGCAVPPSCEVFEYELGLARRQSPQLTPEVLARRLSESYHRIRFEFG